MGLAAADISPFGALNLLPKPNQLGIALAQGDRTQRLWFGSNLLGSTNGLLEVLTALKSYH